MPDGLTKPHWNSKPSSFLYASVIVCVGTA